MSARSDRKRAARRRVMPGFPIEEQLTEPQDVRDYLNGVGRFAAPPGRIVCLLCGKSYRKMAGHVRVHGITVDEYRERYGLPWRTGVASPDCRDSYSRATRKRMGEGWSPPAKDASGMSELHSAPRRAFAPYRGKVTPAPPKGWNKIADDVWAEYLRRIATGRTPADVSTDAGMPGSTAVRERRGADDDFAARYASATEALPFAVQASAEMLGDRFRAECRRLRDEGLYLYQIAERLGVSTMTVQRHIKKGLA